MEAVVEAAVSSEMPCGGEGCVTIGGETIEEAEMAVFEGTEGGGEETGDRADVEMTVEEAEEMDEIVGRICCEVIE